MTAVSLGADGSTARTHSDPAPAPAPTPSTPPSATARPAVHAQAIPHAAAPAPPANRPVTRCQNPDCAKPLTQAGVGRPRKYCTDRCRLASRSSRRIRSAPLLAEHDGYAREIAQDIRSRGAALSRVLGSHHDDVLSRILEAHRLVRDADDLMAALIQQARDRQVPMRDIAALLNVSSDTVRRHWRNRPLSDRMRARRRRNSHPRPTASRAGAAADSPRPRDGARRSRPGNGDSESLADDGSLARFASALSHLQRGSGKSLRTLGRECDISASYVSRVLSGERCPTWPVASRLVDACGGEPGELRALWEAARGYTTALGTPSPLAGLHAALRGLHLAAARPDPAAVSQLTRGALSPTDVHRLLHGPGLPDWDAVDLLVHALRGSCVPIRRIWNTALHESVTREASGLHDAERGEDRPGEGATARRARPAPTSRLSQGHTT